MKQLLSKLFLIAILGSPVWSSSQDFSNLWEGHFSFNKVVDISKGSDVIYAASENAIFSFNVLTNELNTITTIDGLAGQNITTIRYVESVNTILIGYENGLVELYFTDTNEVLSVVDILERENIPPTNRRINYFFENEGLVYIATNYGVSVYDLERLEFGDTYFLGNNGAQITVSQVTVYNNEIYAACLNNNGVKKGNLDNPNLIDFSQWEIVRPGNYSHINTVSDKVFGVETSRNVFNMALSNPALVGTLATVPKDAEVSEGRVNYTNSNEVVVYNENFILEQSFVPNETFNTTFNAAVILNNDVFIGSEDFGVLNNLLDNPDEFLSILPNGPLKNSVFRVDASSGVVWATYGAYDVDLNPFPLNSEGVSYLRREEWTNIPFDSLLGARELNKITPNPNNPSQVFISSFKDGILQMNNFEATILYDETNSGLESLILPGNPEFRGIRVSGAKFDNNGALWSVTSRIARPLKAFDVNNNSWRSYDFTSLIGDPLNDELGFFDLDIDNLGTKWIASYDNGLIAYNEGKSQPLKNLNSQEQNLPFNIVTSVELDQRNSLWVGTIFGLRVLFNTAGFFEDPFPVLSTIVILEDGIPKELLQGQFITDIEVDGSNNKWVGTADSGLFYFSPDGQQTIYHFTEDNSPLPSKAINDIALDASDGKVYIATDRGLVAFSAGGSAPEESLSEAYVYPNPVRPEYEVLGFNNLNDITKGIKIVGLTEDVNIKITDIEGNLVAEAQSRVNLRSSNANYNFAIDGGTAVWNGKNFANNIVSSGVYVIMITDLDNFETKVLKLLIVR